MFGFVSNIVIIVFFDYGSLLMIYKLRIISILLVFIIGSGSGMVIIGLFEIIKVDKKDNMKKLVGVKF